MKPAENGLNRGVMCVYGDLRKRGISNPHDAPDREIKPHGNKALRGLACTKNAVLYQSCTKILRKFLKIYFLDNTNGLDDVPSRLVYIKAFTNLLITDFLQRI